MNGTQHVFFHDDIDGIISASLYLHNVVRGRYRLYPVSSSWRGSKFNIFFPSIIKKKGDFKIILDFQYHKDADLWVDHHFNPDFGECEIKNNKIIYNPKSPSAARLVHTIRLNDTFDYDQSFISLVDMIDSASYKNINQIFMDKSPMMILRAYIERAFPNEMTYCRIVEVLEKTKLDIKEAIYILRIGPYYVRELEKSALQIKNSIVLAKKMSIVNQRRKGQFPRYAELLIFPNIKYILRITPIGNNNVYVEVGYNQWQKEANEINIGKTFSSFDYLVSGGGHYNVGAGIVKDQLLDRFVEDMSKILNQEEEIEPMEKYAVDPTDPVEKKADELIKTGSAKDINQARKDAVKTIKPGQQEVVDGAGKDKQL